MMASIYILFPKEHLDLVQKALQHFQWAVERFEAMSARNSLAKAALGVLHAIYLRLKKSLGLSGQAVRAILASAAQPSSSLLDGASNGGVGENRLSSNPLQLWDSTPFKLSPSASSCVLPAEDGLPSQPPQTGHAIPHQNGDFSSGNGSSCTLISGTTPDFFSDTNTISSGGGGGAFDVNLPNDFDWASLQPIHATGDLIFNDLAGSFSLGPQGADGGDKNFDLTAGGPMGAGMVNGMQICPMTRAPVAPGQLPPPQGFYQFEGCFGDDSVWNLLNQYAPL